MSLAHDIRTIRDRTLAELTTAHDYYDNSRYAWRFLDDAIVAGHTFSLTNAITGTVTTHAELAGRIPRYLDRELAEATFQTFLAVFEAFFTDFVRAWLRAYPQNLLSTEPVPVDVILDAADKQAITEFVIDRAVIGLLYKKPADWFAYIEKKLKLGCPTADEIARLAEAKATRDVLIHNRGVANEVYVEKSRPHARYTVGQQVDVPEPYHRDVWNVLRKVVADLSDAMLQKFP